MPNPNSKWQLPASAGARLARAACTGAQNRPTHAKASSKFNYYMLYELLTVEISYSSFPNPPPFIEIHTPALIPPLSPLLTHPLHHGPLLSHRRFPLPLRPNQVPRHQKPRPIQLTRAQGESAFPPRGGVRVHSHDVGGGRLGAAYPVQAVFSQPLLPGRPAQRELLPGAVRPAPPAPAAPGPLRHPGHHRPHRGAPRAGTAAPQTRPRRRPHHRLPHRAAGVRAAVRAGHGAAPATGAAVRRAGDGRTSAEAEK